MLKYFFFQNLALRSSIRSQGFPMTDTGNPQGLKSPSLRMRERYNRVFFLSFVLLPLPLLWNFLSFFFFWKHLIYLFLLGYSWFTVLLVCAVWMDRLKMLCIYTMEYYSAIKKNETGSFVETWMDLETVKQSEASQKGKNKYHILMHVCGI